MVPNDTVTRLNNIGNILDSIILYSSTGFEQQVFDERPSVCRDKNARGDDDDNMYVRVPLANITYYLYPLRTRVLCLDYILKPNTTVFLLILLWYIIW